MPPSPQVRARVAARSRAAPGADEAVERHPDRAPAGRAAGGGRGSDLRPSGQRRAGHLHACRWSDLGLYGQRRAGHARRPHERRHARGRGGRRRRRRRRRRGRRGRARRRGRTRGRARHGARGRRPRRRARGARRAQHGARLRRGPGVGERPRAFPTGTRACGRTFASCSRR
jgi:hypothetical protein